MKLYKVSDFSGEMEVTEVARQPLKQTDLNQSVSLGPMISILLDT